METCLDTSSIPGPNASFNMSSTVWSKESMKAFLYRRMVPTIRPQLSTQWKREGKVLSEWLYRWCELLCDPWPGEPRALWRWTPGQDNTHLFTLADRLSLDTNRLSKLLLFKVWTHGGYGQGDQASLWTSCKSLQRYLHFRYQDVPAIRPMLSPDILWANLPLVAPCLRAHSAAKDNRFLNPKISYERILMAPPCRLISFPFLLNKSRHAWRRCQQSFL